MPNDGLTLCAIVKELDRLLTGGRVNKVLQPEKDEIALVIYSGGETRRLLLSASPAAPRMHLTAHNKENPLAAPQFCMTLRKHLTGAQLASVTQEGLDRVVKFAFTGTNELYETEAKTLVMEIMAKCSNLILVGENGKIIAACRNVPLDLSSVRQVLPGLPYAPPPAQDKALPTDAEGLRARLAAFPGGDLGKYLANAISGFSRQTAAELAYLATGGTDAGALPARDIQAIIDTAAKFYNAAANLDISPLVTTDAAGKPADFFLFPYETASGTAVPYPTINEAADACYYLKDKHQRFTERSKKLYAALKSAVTRAEKKLALCLDNVERSRNYDECRLFGELVTANLYRVKRGDERLEAENYYEAPPRTVVIPLDKNLSPAENAQRYYKKYAKLKKTFAYNEKQAEELKAHADYLETIAESFTNCTESAELSDIKQELTACGVLKEERGKKRKEAEGKSKPILLTVDGWNIRIGKNNLQNDALTKAAAPQDVWLHASKIHGSHVVIENPEGKPVPDGVLAAAARRAAYYSKARLSDKVPVDYTEKRYVKKPSGAKPGFVIYTNQNTVYVTPKE